MTRKYQLTSGCIYSVHSDNEFIGTTNYGICSFAYHGNMNLETIKMALNNDYHISFKKVSEGWVFRVENYLGDVIAEAVANTFDFEPLEKALLDNH